MDTQTPKRDRNLNIRLTADEQQALREAAAKADRELSDYARRRLLRGLKREPSDEPTKKVRSR